MSIPASFNTENLNRYDVVSALSSRAERAATSGSTKEFKENFNKLEYSRSFQVFFSRKIPKYMHLAASSGSIPIMEFLASKIEERSITNAYLWGDENGNLAIHIAAAKGHTQAVVLLNNPRAYFIQKAVPFLPAPFTTLISEYASPNRFVTGLGITHDVTGQCSFKPIDNRTIALQEGSSYGNYFERRIVNLFDHFKRYLRLTPSIFTIENSTLVGRLIQLGSFRGSPSDRVIEHTKLQLQGPLLTPTPLHLAAENGHEGTVEKLRALGASNVYTDDPKDGMILPLHSAIRGDHYRIVKSLFRQLHESIRKDAITKAGHLACKYGRLPLLKYFARKGLDLNVSVRGETLVSTAVLHGQLEVLKYLHNFGAKIQGTINDPLIRQFGRENPLLSAAHFRGHKEVWNYLLQTLKPSRETIKAIMDAKSSYQQAVRSQQAPNKPVGDTYESKED